MSAIPLRPAISPNDRLGLTLFLAAVVHGIVILGVGFGVNPGLDPKSAFSLDVVLVQTSSEQAPEQAEVAAQTNQQASGSAESGRPTSPFTAPNPSPSVGTAPLRTEAASRPKPVAPKVKTLTAESAPTIVPTEPKTEPVIPEQIVSGRELADRSLEMARLVAEISEREQRYAKRPRIHYIDAVGAKSMVEASYVEAWRNKVQRVGELNYPDEAVRRRLSGSLVLNVLLNRHGEVLRVEIGRSSGHKVLDDAAKRIVELAAPFSAFPVEMRKSYDQLMITRTWRFRDKDRTFVSSD